jgi:phosphatidylserine decarboxylase
LRLTIYGRNVVLKALLFTLLLDIIAFVVPDLTVKFLLLIISAVLFFFTLCFFRDPIRHLPGGFTDKDIVSPADGRVMLIQEIDDSLFLKSRAKLVAIFLSPLDVHVNRIPLTGKIDYYTYVRGGFSPAYRENSADNERTLIGISSGGHKLLMKQIAGIVARRIVCTLKNGDIVKAGEKFGMIKFGSRVDLVMPLHTVIKVKLKQKVIGGKTIIGTL